MTLTDHAPVALGSESARHLTDQIKTGVEAVWHLIEQAYTRRAWSTLGYQSWDDYCTREFGTSRLRLPREERSEIVASLRESGLSIRAIASATGDSRRTVDRALAEGGAIAPVEVIGVNGKTYTPTPQPQEAPVCDTDGGSWDDCGVPAGMGDDVVSGNFPQRAEEDEPEHISLGACGTGVDAWMKRLRKEVDHMTRNEYLLSNFRPSERETLRRLLTTTLKRLDKYETSNREEKTS